MGKPIINIGGSHSKHTGHVKSIGNQIAPVTRVVIDGKEQGLNYVQQFDQWLDSCRNKQAPAIDESDYQAIADRWKCHVAWVKAIFAVESAGNSFNPDGSCKTLNERHLTRRLVRKTYPRQAKSIAKQLGSNLYSMRPGGYKGGVAEWQRIKETCTGIADVTGDFNGALNLALSAASHGGPQILGKHAVPLLGFQSPQLMAEAFHRNEDEQLKAFCTFVEKNGLDKYLKAATGSKDPYPHVVKFAKGYNGKWCCDKNGKRKNYAAEIIRHYRGIAQDYEKFTVLGESRTVQGGVVSTAANAGTGFILSELAGLTNITEVIQQITVLKDKANTMLVEAQAMTGKVNELIAQNTEMTQSLSNNRAMVFFLLSLLILSQFGTFRTLYARITDRLRGYK